jgi:pimeloyl-ACP methyl ester carboxylesterase
VALDLPGHGESSKPPVEWYSLRRFGEVVEEVARLLNLRRPVLVGHSMGGTIALDIAAGGALPLRGVIGVNPVVSGRIGFGPSLPETVTRPVAAVTRKVWPVAARLLRGAPDRMGRSAPDTWRRMREDVGRTSGDAAVGSIRAVLHADLSRQIPGITCPAMLVVGRHDRVVPASEGRLAARLVSGATLLELDCGHHPHDERRGEFLAETRRFLESVRSS